MTKLPRISRARKATLRAFSPAMRDERIAIWTKGVPWQSPTTDAELRYLILLRDRATTDPRRT